MKILKALLFFLLMFLLWVPIIQQNTGYFTEPELKGAFTMPPKPELSKEHLSSSEYQKQLEDYLNYRFGFRGLFVKIKNSLGYLLWNEVPVSDNIIGKDGYFFSKGSILRSIGADYNGKEKNQEIINKISFFKEGLAHRGIPLLILMAPSKESVMPGFMPYIYHGKIKDRNDYSDILRGCAANNISFLDLCSYLRKAIDTSAYPLFTKTGFHWSIYGASVAHDLMIRKIAHLFKEPMPTYVREGVEWSDTSRLSDNDFEYPMNFLFKLKNPPYAYPKLKIIETTEKKRRPKVIIIGDSFFMQLKSQKMMSKIFSEDSKFWFYFASTSYSLDDVSSVPLSDLNIMNELYSADLVIISGSVGNLTNFPFGITDYYYNNVAAPSIFEGVHEYIVSRPNWLSSMKNKASAQNKHPEDIITAEAKQICRDRLIFNLKASNGLFVCANSANHDLVTADKQQANTWETFSVLKLDENNVAIISSQDKFFSAELNAKGEITANRIRIGDWETFKMIKLGDNFVAFMAANGKYLSLDEKSLQLFAVGNAIGKAEKFQVIIKKH
jgi:hypothetical protein